jgi:hypothetical protein
MSAKQFNVDDCKEEILWNKSFLLQTTKHWNTAVVLCSYKRLEYWEVKELAKIFANKLDHHFGQVKKGNAYNVSQRLEKLQMLEYGEEVRGWHVNALINRPSHIDEDAFFDEIRSIWIKLQKRSSGKRHFNKKIKLVWCEKAKEYFHRYSVKQRAKTIRMTPHADTVNDLIVTSTFTIHEKTINS